MMTKKEFGIFKATHELTNADIAKKLDLKTNTVDRWFCKGMKPPKHIKARITENIINNKDYRYEKYGVYNERSK